MDSALLYLSTEVAENTSMDFVDPQGEKKEYFTGVIIPTVDFSLFHISLKNLCTTRNFTQKEREKERQKERKTTLQSFDWFWCTHLGFGGECFC